MLSSVFQALYNRREQPTFTSVGVRRTVAPAHAINRLMQSVGDDAFEHVVREFTVAYADQAERDHTNLVEAIKRGRVRAEHDV